MLLTVTDRIIISNMKPQKSDLKTLIIFKDIDKKIELTQDEIIECELNQDENGFMRWKNNIEKNVDFTNAEIDVLKDVCNKLDKENSITPQMLDTVLKIKEDRVDNKVVNINKNKVESNES